MNVHVYTARQDKGARRINLSPAARAAAELNDLPVQDADVTLTRAARRDHGSAPDNQIALDLRNLCSPQTVISTAATDHNSARAAPSGRLTSRPRTRPPAG
jgi:hypothetical protein